MKTKPCVRCEGTGRIPDQEDLGKRMRSRRKKAGVSLRAMAKRLDISAPYLSDMELGRRNWLEPYMKEYWKLTTGKAKE